MRVVDNVAQCHRDPAAPRVSAHADQWTDWDEVGISSIKLALGKENLESVKQEQGVLAKSTANKKRRDMTKGFSTK